MAKDRFNRFKPVNWNSDFKQTGNLGTRYNTLDRVYAYDAHQANDTLKAELQQKKLEKQRQQKQKFDNFRTNEEDLKLQYFFKYFKDVFNDWEREFVLSVALKPFKLSDKQRDVLKKIAFKYPDKFDEYVYFINEKLNKEDSSESPFY